MKKSLKASVAFIAIFACVVANVNAQSFTDTATNGIPLIYTVNGSGTVSLTGHGLSCSGALIIPDSVSYNGFSYNVIRIGNSAFDGCSGLTSVTIPNSVSSIEEFAFRRCSGLTSVVFNATNCTYTGTGDPVFVGCTNLVTLTIGDNVTNIPDHAFEYCSGLTSVTIPNSVTSIGELAFGDCSGLTSVTIPNSVTSIGRYAFSGCSGMTSVTIPNSVTSIGELAFRGCSDLTSVVFNATNCTYMGSASAPVFEGCTNLATLTIGDNVTNIPSYAFRGCSGLTSITIPNSVTNIGSSAFQNCRGLTDISIGSGVSSIAEYAFAGCDHLMQMTCSAAMPPTVAEVNAFDDIYRAIPIYVPTASVSLYQVAYGWCEFTNYIGVGTYTVTAQSANATMGTVSGGGSYVEGSVATLTANANAGYHFVHWQDGNTDNPRVVTVTGDTTFSAFFAENGNSSIDEITSSDIHISVSDGRIIIQSNSLNSLHVDVYDIMGRHISSFTTTGHSHSTKLPSGIYIVRINNQYTQKVVLTR
ncbi:MAG: leucine-rich repeat domain-containing protein [Bacteroidales bacterium]|nr:leucine-rich repeat domain-containing protein [Bacteroidales bacterium]